MLVLTRKEGETILIGDKIKIQVVKVLKDNRVKIGIQAPEDLTILRGELHEEVKHENIKASQGDLSQLDKMWGEISRKKGKTGK